MQLKPHKLIYYNDGRHANLYQYEPPMTREQLELVVDEIAGTPIDTLFYCMGDGRTMLYDTKVGEVWGHNVTAWSTIVYYRTAENIRSLLARGIDPMRVVCDRAHEKGLSFFPVLLVQNPRDDTSGRCSDFWLKNTHLALGLCEGIEESRATLLDFAHLEVREERYSLVDEVITNYPVDGVELQLAVLYPYFKPRETEKNTPLLTEWVRRIRRRLDEVGAERGQFLELAIQVPGSLEACRRVGIDLETWVREGLVNMITAGTLDGFGEVMQQDMDLRPFVNLARGTGIRVNGAIHGMVLGEEHTHATIPYWRAAASNLWHQGVDGIFLAHFFARWPYDACAYAILREVGDPEALAWGDKRYFLPTVLLQQKADRPSYFGYRRQLPKVMKVGEATEVVLPISDDVAKAAAQGRLAEVSLHVRSAGAVWSDYYQVRLNGHLLPDDLQCKRDMSFLLWAPKFRAEYGYWLDYQLDETCLPSRGDNTVAVTPIKRASDLAVPMKLRDVELDVKYRPGRNWWRWDVAP